MKKNFIFYLLFFCFFVALILSLFKAKDYKHPVFGSSFNSVNVIIETNSKDKSDILFKDADNILYAVHPIKNVLNARFENKIENLDIFVKEGVENKTGGIVIFNDIKPYYFKDFSQFKKSTVEICPHNICYKYSKYEVPKSVKYNENSEFFNLKSNIHMFLVNILSLFAWNFSLTLILFFITILYFINNQNEIKLPKNLGYYLTCLIFVFGITVYSNGLFEYGLWTDEFHTLEYSNPDKGFLNLFSDPGNPPLFYILFRVYLLIFGGSLIALKLFPFITGVLAVFILWLFLKEKISLKAANFGAFLAFINVPLIYYSNEIRSYILQALFTPLIVYFLFKILKTGKTKDYIIYALLSALVFNLHYYEALFLCSNFVFALIYFLKEKRYKDIFKFFLSNIVGFIFFLPFFIVTAYKGALLNSGFNSWIDDINFNRIKKCVFYLFGGGISLILSTLFFIKNLIQKEKNLLLIYSFSVIIFTIFLAVILSYSIRPMLIERYLVLLVPLFIIFLCSVFFDSYKNKYAAILFIIWVLLIQSNSFEKNNRKKALIETTISLSKQYAKLNETKNVYAILNIPNPENKGGEIKIVSKNSSSIENAIDEIFKNDKNAVVFTPLLTSNLENSKKPDNYTCYFNSAADICLWKINYSQNNSD